MTTRRAFTRGVGAAASLAAWGMPVRAPAAGARPFGDSVGLNVKFAHGQPLADLPSLLELGVRWVRDPVPWTDIEPQAGRLLGLPAGLARRVAFYRDHGIGLVALLTLGNERAYPLTPGGSPAAPHDPAAFGRYAAAVARALQASGVRFVLELGNEPHNSVLRRRLGGQWQGRAPSPWVDHYLRMAAAAVAEVKAVDPAIRLLTDDDMWVVHHWFIAGGLPRALDGFAVHPYTRDVPERTAVAHDTDWTRPFSVVDPDRSFGSAVRRLRDAGAAVLERPPQIWVTEWGWPVGTATGVGEAQLAAYLPRAFVLAAAAGVEALCWFSAQDTVDGPMGLTDNQGRRRPAFHALRTLTRELGDKALVRHAAGADRPATGVQAFVFEGAGERTLVAWHVDGMPSRLPLPAGAPLRATHAEGSVLAPQAAADGRVHVPFDGAPIYVTGTWSDADALAAAAAAA